MPNTKNDFHSNFMKDKKSNKMSQITLRLKCKCSYLKTKTKPTKSSHIIHCAAIMIIDVDKSV
ncbi:hypothetical protein Bhyg_17239, partial [Pseudolycoriella hygida]